MQASLENAVREMWLAAAAELVAESEQLEVDRRAALEIMDKALARLDVAVAAIARLRERLARHEDSLMSAANAIGV